MRSFVNILTPNKKLTLLSKDEPNIVLEKLSQRVEPPKSFLRHLADFGESDKLFFGWIKEDRFGLMRAQPKATLYYDVAKGQVFPYENAAKIEIEFQLHEFYYIILFIFLTILIIYLSISFYTLFEPLDFDWTRLFIIALLLMPLMTITLDFQYEISTIKDHLKTILDAEEI